MSYFIHQAIILTFPDIYHPKTSSNLYMMQKYLTFSQSKTIELSGKLINTNNRVTIRELPKPFTLPIWGTQT